MNNLRYSIMESPHRWWILAALSLGAAVVGTIFIFAFEWSHVIARIWLYAGLLLTLLFLILGVVDWKARMEAAIEEAERRSSARRAD